MTASRGTPLPSTGRTVWVLRALLAAVLAFASEVLLWTTPNARDLVVWAILAVGYLALATALLDIAARFRWRDLFGLMALAGVYGLVNALLLNPTSAFVDFPRTFFTRAMGGHALAGTVGLTLWLLLTSGKQRNGIIVTAGIVAVGIGGVWGYWAHYSPPIFAEGEPAALTSLLSAYGVMVALIVTLILIAQRVLVALPEGVPATAFQTDRFSGAFVFVAAVALGGAHFAAGTIDGTILTLVILFASFCAGIVWFQKRKKGVTLIDGRGIGGALPLFIGLALLGVAAGVVGYHLPRVAVTPSGETDPLAAIGAILTAYGLVWLPMVTFILGAREFNKLARAMRL